MWMIDYGALVELVTKHSEKTLPHCHFSHKKAHMDWPRIEIRPYKKVY